MIISSRSSTGTTGGTASPRGFRFCFYHIPLFLLIFLSLVHYKLKTEEQREMVLNSFARGWKPSSGCVSSSVRVGLDTEHTSSAPQKHCGLCFAFLIFLLIFRSE